MDRVDKRLALIEWLGIDRRASRSVDVMQWPISLGRGVHNTVVLDDPAVSAEHAYLNVDEHGALRVMAGVSRNGVAVDGRVLRAGESQGWAPGAERVMRLGDTTLRVRCPGDALPEEVAMSSRGRRPAASVAVVLTVAWLLWMVAEYWIRLDPGAGLAEWLPLLVGAPLGLLLWCLVWGLASKVFRHHFDMGGHLAVAGPALLAMAAVDALAPQIAASLGWSSVAETGRWVAWGIGIAWMRQHVLIVLPHPSRRAVRILDRATVACAFAVMAIYLGVFHRQTERWRGDLYLSALPLPALRWHRAVPVDQFLESAERLQRRLDARVAADREDAAEDDGDDDGS